MSEMPHVAPQGVNRRDVLKRGAVIGAATVWTIPVISAVSMTPAHADTTSSAPGGGSTQPAPPPVTVPTEAPSSNQSGAVLGERSTNSSSGSGGSTNAGAPASGLAFTGAPAITGAAVGVAALAAGAGLIAVSRRRDDSEPEPEAD